MALIRTPRSRWVEKGLQALASGGPDAVRVETLARALGVSKGGFYWHFDDRNGLLTAMLDEFERSGVDQVVELVENEGGDARAKLRRLFAITSSVTRRTRIELAVRDWARKDKSVARRLKRIDRRRMEYLRVLFGEFCSDELEVEVRSLLTLSLYVGGHFIAADHPGMTREEVVVAAESWLLA